MWHRVFYAQNIVAAKAPYSIARGASMSFSEAAQRPIQATPPNTAGIMAGSGFSSSIR
jgi:hypothetical protein